ncbi:MAG: type II toxin-antitoxin system VapC family toxin [Micromonosporaceae bacterium]
MAATTRIADLGRDGGQFAMPATVLAETLVSTARYRPSSLGGVRTLLTQMFGPARVIDEEVAVQAAALRAKHRSLRLPDALVIAVGIVDDASMILTADKRWAAVDQRVEVLG